MTQKSNSPAHLFRRRKRPACALEDFATVRPRDENAPRPKIEDPNDYEDRQRAATVDP